MCVSADDDEFCSRYSLDEMIRVTLFVVFPNLLRPNPNAYVYHCFITVLVKVVARAALSLLLPLFIICALSKALFSKV